MTSTATVTVDSATPAVAAAFVLTFARSVASKSESSPGEVNVSTTVGEPFDALDAGLDAPELLASSDAHGESGGVPGSSHTMTTPQTTRRTPRMAAA